MKDFGKLYVTVAYCGDELVESPSYGGMRNPKVHQKLAHAKNCGLTWFKQTERREDAVTRVDILEIDILSAGTVVESRTREETSIWRGSSATNYRTMRGTKPDDPNTYVTSYSWNE